MLDTPSKLGKIIVGMTRALGDTPVTVKLRNGVKDNRFTAHTLMPRLATEWNASCLTVSAPLPMSCFKQSAVAWTNSPATIHKIGRLGLH